MFANVSVKFETFSVYRFIAVSESGHRRMIPRHRVPSYGERDFVLGQYLKAANLEVAQRYMLGLVKGGLLGLRPEEKRLELVELQVARQSDNTFSTKQKEIIVTGVDVSQ
jgi:hypothetical protein